MAESKKYYWLKLHKDFFKRHDIRIIESMPNGKEYVLFYMKLLLESVDHEGTLRFSDTIPYNDLMLSTITNTNIDIVRSAVKVFKEMEMMDVLDDGTLHMEQASKMLGFETDWKYKKQAYREKKKLELEESTKEGQKEDMSDKSKSIELEIELEIEKDNIDASVSAVNPVSNEEFNEWWKAYPKKEAKKDCSKIYKNLLKKNKLPPLEEHIAKIEKWKLTEKWIEGFIPNPKTWLNGERWNDEITSTKKSSKPDQYNMGGKVDGF